MTHVMSLAHLLTPLWCLGIMCLHASSLAAADDQSMLVELSHHFAEATLTANSLTLLTHKQGERFFVIKGKSKRLSNYNETISVQSGEEIKFISKHWNLHLLTRRSNGENQVAILKKSNNRSTGGKLESEENGYAASGKQLRVLTKKQIQFLFRKHDQK